jgi:hypothetical protein
MDRRPHGIALHEVRRSEASCARGGVQACERKAKIYSLTFGSGEGARAKSEIKTTAKNRSGGRGRTRTYEGIASGFTVRPLCRSGHSPPKPLHRIDLERQSAASAGRSGFAGFMGRCPYEVNAPSSMVCKPCDRVGIGSRWPKNPGNPSRARAGLVTSDRSPRVAGSVRPLHTHPTGPLCFMAGTLSKPRSKIPPGAFVV